MRRPALSLPRIAAWRRPRLCCRTLAAACAADQPIDAALHAARRAPTAGSLEKLLTFAVSAPVRLLTEIMLSKSVVALALIESTQAFQAPAMKASGKTVKAAMFEEGDIGVLPPLGVYDPLGLIESRDMRRYEIMEIKHGRGAHACICVHSF